MKFKKATTGFLALSILSISAATAFAMDTPDFKSIHTLEGIDNVMPISTELELIRGIKFGSVTGTVTKITDFEGVEGSKFILLENEEGIVGNIVVSNETYILNKSEITVGSVVTGYYDANAPMILIYPPQYKAEVVVVNKEGENVKVDRFNEELVSSDNLLKLNVLDDTEIVSKDGNPFDGELANRNLVVVYDVSTRSIPAQTNPIKVVVLPEYEEDIIVEETEKIDVSNMDIVVNDKAIEAPSAYTNEDGVVMVPLRAIAEALEYDVKWDASLNSVMIGKGISLKIGEDNYNYMKTAPIKLGTAPELVEGKTFVPLKFFKEVLRMNNAYVFEAQIVIDNGEIMN